MRPTYQNVNSGQLAFCGHDARSKAPSYAIVDESFELLVGESDTPADVDCGEFVFPDEFVDARPADRQHLCGLGNADEQKLQERLSDLDAVIPDDDDSLPMLLAISDNGTEMRSSDTRKFMARMSIAQHFGRPSTPTDQAWIETLWGHLKWEHGGTAPSTSCQSCKRRPDG